MDACKAWQAKKAAAGYAQIRWPKEWGGGGGTTIQSVIFAQEESRMGVQLGGPFAIGLGMCIPTVMATADDETKKRFVGPAVQWSLQRANAGSDGRVNVRKCRGHDTSRKR